MFASLGLSTLALVLALAETPDPEPVRDIYFRPQHVGLFGVSVATALFTSVPQLNPRQPRRWLSPGPVDRRARNALNASRTAGEIHQGSQIASDVFGLGLPTVAFIGSTVAWAHTSGLGRRRRTRYILQDLAVVFEAWGFALTTTNVLKIAVGRQRPYVRAGLHETPAVVTPYRDDRDQNASFPSGHATFAFSIAVSGATVASMRRYPRWRLAWLALIPAASVPLLRVAADQHYLSDVLVGSAIGAGIGAAVPLLIHNPRLRTKKAEVAVGPFGRGIQVSGRW